MLALSYTSILLLLLFLLLWLSLIFVLFILSFLHYFYLNVLILLFFRIFFENDFLEQRVYAKQSLYLAKVGIRSAYIPPFSDPTCGNIVVVILLSFNIYDTNPSLVLDGEGLPLCYSGNLQSTWFCFCFAVIL